MIMAKTLKGALRILESALPHQPPRRFWCKKDNAEQWQWPYPLHSKRNTIRPLRCIVYKAIQHASSNQLTHNPAQVHIDLHVTSDSNRKYFRGITRAKRSKNTPRQTTEHFPSKKDANTGCCERHGDETCNEDIANEKDFAISKAVSQISICKNAKYDAYGGAQSKCNLPWSCNLVPIAKGLAVSYVS